VVPRAVTWLATEAGLEIVMGEVSALPTWRQLIHFSVRGALDLCILPLIGLQMWLRWVWARSLP